jgi:hypothetical protein
MGRWSIGKIFASKSKEEVSITSRPAKKFLWICLVGKLFDNITTYIAVSSFGPIVEGNPIVRNLIYRYGLLPAMIINFFIGAGLMYLLYCVAKKNLMMILSCVMIWLVVCNNIIGIIRGLM